MYGSTAYPMVQKNENDHTHRWTVYVRGFNDEDISYYVKRVQFKLHESFTQATRSTSVRGVPVGLRRGGCGGLRRGGPWA